MTTQNNSPAGSFSSTAFFEEEFFPMSKFENFLDKSRQKATRTQRQNGGKAANNVISPRSDDGMSCVSRKKHDNYAHVVMEMKRKNGQQQQQQLRRVGTQQRQQVGQSHSPMQWGNESEWSNFDSNHFHRPTQHAPPQHVNNNNNRPQQNTFKEPVQRPGRKLYRESAASSNNNNNALQRSRSTVRRTADLQRKLAQTYISAKGDDDCHSEAGESVISSVFLNSKSGSGSWDPKSGSGSWGGDSGSFGSYNNTGSYGSNGPRKKNGLDSLLLSSSKRSPSDDSSVVSGTGSVAARRRAKAALQHRPQVVEENKHYSVPTLMQPLPPPSNSARRNMRARMQNTKFPKNAFQLDHSIEDEVNSALNELKLDHPEMDFTFDAMVTTGEGSVDSSVSGREGYAQPSTGESPKFKKDMRGRHSPDPSQKTLTTKSLTLESSESQHVVSSQRASARSSVGTVAAQGKIVSPHVISVEQYESLERCSESSSLTEASDWHVGGGGSASSTAGTNMFKDATRGSTFHKSKRIVRAGECISENKEKDSPVRPEKEVGIDENSVMPSIKDRISKFKSGGTASPLLSSPSSKIYNSSTIKEESSQRSSLYSSSSSNTMPTSSRSRTGLPPQAPTSSPFQVKLRKTKNMLDEVADHTTDLGAAAEEGEAPASNQFLSGVKLRSTGTPSWKERQQAKQEADEQRDSNDHRGVDAEDAVEPAPEPARKLTYREQQDLLKQQQEREQVKEEPKKDVATLIRERVAMNKQNNSIPPSPKSSAGSELDIGALRGNLKKTSYGTRDTATSSNRMGPQTPTSPNSPQYVAPSSRPVVSPKEESGPNPKQALNAMLAGRLGSPPVREEKKMESPSDPRTAIGNRATKDDPPVDSRAALMSSSSKRSEKQNSSPADPRAALMASISKLSPSMADDDEEVVDPKASLAAMLQKRVAMNGGDASTPSKSEGENNLSSVLSQRAQPSEAKQPADLNAVSDGKPALKNDPKYEKYFKMLKVGMPLPAVQHAMTRDGLDPSVMEGDHNKPAPEPKPEGLPLKEDPAYAKYFKMLKLGLPMGAVKNAMERDGLDSSVMDGNHNLPVSELISNSPATKKRQKDTHRRTRLHWDTLVGKVKSNTVWALVNKDEELDNIVIDETEFTNLFQAEIKSSSAPVEKSGSSARNVVQVIDPKRANNGGIILARLRMSYDDMAKAVERIDETAMTANQAQGIVEYMPTLEERKKLRDYMKTGDGDSASKFDKLCECEKFMVAMMTVKQSKRKLRALLFKLQFRGCIHDLARDVFSIEKACDELSASVRLRKLLGIVLNIGNRLNTAGPGEKRKAGAFSVKSLLKLNQAKAFDNKTTFLHYVVLVVQRNSEYLLDFKDDLPTALKADKIYWDQCVNELEEVETQLENFRKLALHEAKASKVVYSLPSKNKHQEDNDSDDLSVASISLEEEVASLRSTKIGMFALSAIKKVSQLRERVDISREKFCQLLEYFGEDAESSTMQPHELFEIISTFCRNFDAAREDVNKMEKAKKRDEKKNQDSGCQKDERNSKQTIDANPPRAPPPKKNTMLRSSSCQPNMSSVLADLKRVTSNESNDQPEKTTYQSARVQNKPPSVQRTQPQSSDTTSNNVYTTKVAASSSDYPSELLNNASLKIKYPEDEPNTPERTSPVESKAQSIPTLTQRSSESETTPVPSTSEASAEPQKMSISPSKTALSRRERLERVRSRSFSQSKMKSNSQSSPTVLNNMTKEPTSNPEKPANKVTEEPTPKLEKPAPKPNVSPTTSQISARAAARDRYARHKKMMHQRKATN